MGNSEITKIVDVRWQQAEQELRRIRQQVFVEEQHVSPEEEWDGDEQHTTHFLAYQHDTAVACARLQASGKIQRMAVLSNYRGQGIGSALLQHVVNYAYSRGQNEVYLDAQVQALEFYQRLGFVAEGEEFIDAGMRHKRMRKTAKPTADEVVRLEGTYVYLQAFRIALTNAHHSLDILTDHLTPVLYADPEVVGHTSQLARRSPRSKIRILVKDTRPLQGRPHGLVQLAQRLPSRIGLRGLREMPQNPRVSYMLIDKKTLIYFNDEAAFTGFSRANARAEGRHLLDEFNHLWESYSGEDPNLKLLAL